MTDVATFWCAPTGKVRRTLRTFTFAADDPCPGGGGLGHSAVVDLDVADAQWGRYNSDGSLRPTHAADPARVLVSGSVARRALRAAEHRWPTVCATCGGDIGERAHRVVDTHELYATAGQPDVFELDSLPPGAMFDAWWLPDSYRGSDGIALTVVLPDGHRWHVDARAKNCPRPDDDHACWCRHGDPRSQPVTVDKSCDTCTAGAGSVQTATWHGFLRNGVLKGDDHAQAQA